MPVHPAILLYGRDTCLLQTRSWVLASAGYRVTLADRALGQAPSAVGTDLGINLVILCHSLSYARKQKVLSEVDRCYPMAQRLCLPELRSTPELVELYQTALVSPEQLLHVVANLLNSCTGKRI